MTPHIGRDGSSAPARPAATPTAGRLAVDWTRCDGHGLCAALLPERIVRDEWGFPVVLDPAVNPDSEPEARVAVAACPALALYLTTMDTTTRAST